MLTKSKSRFLVLLLVVAIFSALALAGCGSTDETTLTVSSVEFVGMPAPSTDEERSSVYTTANVIVTYNNGSSKTFPLSYNNLYQSTDIIGGVTAGMMVDADGNPIIDTSVAGKSNAFVSDSPDANSLMQITGASATGKGGNPLSLVTHFEYVTADNSGTSSYGLLPMVMNLATIDQDKTTGLMSVVKLKNINMTDSLGLWIPCAGSLSPWNTHLGSEEYEPDARAVEKGDLYSNTGKPILNSINKYYNNTTTAKVYHYGHVPEVTVNADGSTKVLKHYAMGRISRELTQVMPDNRTVYMGDDGAYTGLFLFTADKEKDLSAGTIYAAKWSQTSSANGGTANLSWMSLGHSTDSEIKQLAETLKFSDIFETATIDTSGFTKIKTNNNSNEYGFAVEWLKLRPGMEKAAAFLETRRYAAMLGATTEFEKMEGVTVNAKDKKVYIAMTRIDKGMKAQKDDPADHIQLPKLTAGVVYELGLAAGQKDTAGKTITSDFIATTMAGLLSGEDLTAPDAVGNIANAEKISNPDNLKFSEKMRTLFIGEDSGQHINNFLWAYNVDNKKLSRILSIPAGAESTGLQAIDDLNGFAYIMSNYQHPGDFIATTEATLKKRLENIMLTSGMISRVSDTVTRPVKGSVGYISGIPGL